MFGPAHRSFSRLPLAFWEYHRMSKTTAGSGGDFLTKKSEVISLRQKLPDLSNVLVIEDEDFDADRLCATLRVIFGYDLNLRHANSLTKALDMVLQQKPELIFLDDVLKPSDNAAQSIPFLRRADYDGPIVIVSGQVTSKRAFDLKDIGAIDVIHKDDVDSVRLGEALIRVFGKNADLKDESAGQ